MFAYLPSTRIYTYECMVFRDPSSGIQHRTTSGVKVTTYLLVQARQISMESLPVNIKAALYSYQFDMRPSSMTDILKKQLVFRSLQFFLVCASRIFPLMVFYPRGALVFSSKVYILSDLISSNAPLIAYYPATWPKL